jgi:hypothetical protein
MPAAHPIRVAPGTFLWPMVSGERGDIFRFDGGNLLRLTTTGDVIGMGLREGGSEMIWARQISDSGQIRLFVMGLTQRSVRALPFPLSPPELLLGKGLGHDHLVQFSPDGQRLAFVSVASEAATRDRLIPPHAFRIAVCDLAGKQWSIVHDRPLGSDSYAWLAWSPDSGSYAIHEQDSDFALHFGGPGRALRRIR